jgi:diacylglycerol O-acyltransferase / wax synthase
MERLTGMDAAFVHMETSDVPLHVMAIVILDPTTAPREWSFEAVRSTIAERIHLLPPFRRRLIEAPLALTRPAWIDDPDVDLDAHIHHVAVPAPHTDRELAALVGHIAGVPLDRRRPLWDMWVIEGGPRGRVALVTKIHHSAVDGVVGADLMMRLFDVEANGTAADPAEPDEAGPEAPATGVIDLAVDAVGQVALRPLRAAGLLMKTGRRLLAAAEAQRRGGADGGPTALPFTAPTTPFNRAITARRAVAYTRVPLDDVKRVRRAFDATVNDVVLAACTMSLRRWLAAHGGLPNRDLVATLPVSVPLAAPDAPPSANEVSAMMVSLPVLEGDPVAQLQAVRSAAASGKRIHGALGPELLSTLAGAAPPQLLWILSTLYSKLDLADHHRPVHNLVISNTRGPPFPLFFAGARVEAVYPIGPVLEGAALNISVISYADDIDVCAIADRDLVPDLWDITGGIAEAVTALGAAPGETRGPRPSAARAARPGGGR